MNKLLTIIIPSYNMEKHLTKCLDSLIVDDFDLFQTLDIVVVNDGSRDGTSRIGHEFEQRYPDVIRVIDKDNGHYGSCINVALPTVKGKYVKILDADDTFETQGLKILLEFIRRTDSDVIITDFTVVDEYGSVLSQRNYGLDENVVYTPDSLPKSIRTYLEMHAVAYRSAIFNNLEYIQSEGIVFTDQEWMFVPMSACKSIRYLPVKVYRYLVGREGQSVSANVNIKIINAILLVALKMTDEYAKRQNKFSPCVINYMRDRLEWRTAGAYRAFLIEYSSVTDKQLLLCLDKKLKLCAPDIYKALDEMRIWRRIPFRYISAWRRTGSFTGVGFFLSRWFYRNRNAIGKMVAFFKGVNA